VGGTGAVEYCFWQVVAVNNSIATSGPSAMWALLPGATTNKQHVRISIHIAYHLVQVCADTRIQLQLLADIKLTSLTQAVLLHLLILQAPLFPPCAQRNLQWMLP
jgi:hypothetical protein